FVVRVSQERVLEVLRVPGLFAAEPPVERILDNNAGGVILGVNQVRTVGSVSFLVNLDGRGEIGGMVDSGCDVGDLAGATPPFTGAVMTAFHPDLVTNVRLVRNTSNPGNAALHAPDIIPDTPPRFHGTHVAGTICGDGTSSAGQVRGMAPAASFVAMGPLPNGDFNRSFELAFQHGARAINNSWGSAPAGGGITHNQYRNDSARTLDRWCFAHPDVLLLFAAGNSEGDTTGNGVLDARTLSFEVVAKNVLSVGATENLRNNGGWRDSYRVRLPGPRFAHANFNTPAGGAAGAFTISDGADEVAMFSSRGTVTIPGGAVTGRIKPDIAAPGTNVLSLRSQWVKPPPALPGPPIANAFWNANADSMLPAGLSRTLYSIKSGTSMACPHTTGSALLVRQYYRTRFAQLRRPLLLQGIALPAAAPFPVFAGFPSVAAHPDGL